MYFLLKIICAVFAVICFCFSSDALDLEKVQHYSYSIVNTYPHNSCSWTQGLVFEDNFLYESTGRYGYSCVSKVELETGKSIKIRMLDKKFYGEGLTIFNDKIILLTWLNHTGFVYNKDFFLLKNFSYSGQGWGLTSDGKNLIMSDGSCFLYFIEPDTFKQIRQIMVSENGVSIKNLNELEYIDGKIYANVWMTDKIVIISPQTGNVTGCIDLKGIMPLKDRENIDSVLNGIAYDSDKKRLFITGKLWPSLFEIKIIPAKLGEK